MSQSYMPEMAPLVFLTFLGAGAALAVLLLSCAAAAAFRRWTLAKLAAGAAILVAGLYTAGLLALSVHSEDKTLALRDRKYFCEVDCHLAYSVEDVRVATAASGNRWLVTLRAWFDRNTISAFRGDSPLGPSPRIAWVLDERGARYEIPPAALAPLEVPLRPGESAETRLVVRLPAAVRRPRLFVGDPPGLERLVPGHENSPGHGRIYFALTTSPSLARESGGRGSITLGSRCTGGRHRLAARQRARPLAGFPRGATARRSRTSARGAGSLPEQSREELRAAGASRSDG